MKDLAENSSSKLEHNSEVQGLVRNTNLRPFSRGVVLGSLEMENWIFFLDFFSCVSDNISSKKC